jgi:TetR/AcrR family transcriptional regulator, regulator of autoinduction and epiphytic fitness
MTSPVKNRRRYESPRRREQAAQTRRDITTAAGVRFRRDGYPRSSMSSIAAEAGVAVETIYRAFGSKAALFKAVIEAAVAGGVSRADVAVEERPAIRAIIDETDPRRKIARYAATQPGIHRRAGPLLRALSGAMALDPALKELWDEIERDRRSGQGRFAASLVAGGVLRPGLSEEEAGDIIWLLCSLAVHDQLVMGRGWSPERYEDWLTATLVRELLPPDR